MAVRFEMSYEVYEEGKSILFASDIPDDDELRLTAIELGGYRETFNPPILLRKGQHLILSAKEVPEQK